MKRSLSFMFIVSALLLVVGLVGCNGLWDFDDDDDVAIMPANFKFLAQINVGAPANNIRAAAISSSDYNANVYYEDDPATALNGSTPVTADNSGNFSFDYNAFDGKTFFIVFSHKTNASALKLYRYFKKTKAEMDAYATTPAVVNEKTTAVGFYLQNNPGKKYSTDVDENTTSVTEINDLVTTITNYNDTANAGDNFVVPVKTVTISQTSPLSVQFGNSVTLTAVVEPSFATNKTVTWAMTPADSTLVALNTTTGVITANSTTEGPVTITATADGKTSAPLTVNVISGPVAVTSVEIVQGTGADLAIGGELNLSVTVLPPNATNKALNWSISPSGFATVVSTGDNTAKITGTSAGEATVTVTSTDGSNKSDTFIVKVITAPTTTTVNFSNQITGQTSALIINIEGTGLDTSVTCTLKANDDSDVVFSKDKTSTTSDITLQHNTPGIALASFQSIVFSKVLPAGTIVRVANSQGLIEQVTIQ